MASRLHESINSLGVLLSLAVSFFTFYSEHLATSEAVDALLSNLSVKTDDNAKIESVTADLIFVNKGDTSVTVSELWFEVDGGTGTRCCGRLAALKANEDTVIVPIELPSKHADKVSIAFKYQFIAPAYILGLSSGNEDPPREPIPPPPQITIEKMSIALSLTTIGPVHGYQEMTMPIGLLHVDDEKLRTYGAAFIPSELIPIRQDPPLLRSLWRSVTN
jgi:hypothetical protein